MTYSKWTWGPETSTSADATIWFGEQEDPVFCDPDTTPWQELYHEEDYQGIADQLLAEELGYA